MQHEASITTSHEYSLDLYKNKGIILWDPISYLDPSASPLALQEALHYNLIATAHWLLVSTDAAEEPSNASILHIHPKMHRVCSANTRNIYSSDDRNGYYYQASVKKQIIGESFWAQAFS